jgi:hypothetical protein
MKKDNFMDKVTGLNCEVIDVSTNSGSINVYVKLSNGEVVTRELRQLVYLESKEVK